jgi:hypothetical protein
VLAIAVPWYAALYHRYGWTYITSFLVGENFARYTEGLGVETRRGFSFYIPVVFSDSFPWSLCLFGAAGLWLSDWRASRRRKDAAGDTAGIVPDQAQLALRVRTLLWLWVLGTVGFFTFSAAKQDLYIFPIVPAVAALGGLYIARETASGSVARPRSLRLTAAAIGLFLSVAGAGTLYIFQTAGKVYALDGAAFVGAAAAAGGMVAFALALANRSRAALAAVLLSLVTLNWAFVIRVLPSFERYKPVPPLSAAISQRLGEGDIVAHYNVALPSMVYYLRRHIDILFEQDPFLQLLRGDRTVFAVLSDSDYAQLEPVIGVDTCVLDRRPTVNIKLKAVLARDPLPQVLLITNRCDGESGGQ